MRLEIVGSADTAQAKAGLEQLTAQVEMLNKAMESTTKLSMGATPRTFAQTTAAVKSSDAAFKNALASSGQFEVQQLKLGDATEKYTKALSTQTLSLKQAFGTQTQGIMDQVYRRQLAIRNGFSTMLTGVPGDGTVGGMLAIPSEIPKEWDTFANRVGFASARLQSGGQVLLNWGKNAQWAGRQLTVGLTVPLAAFGAAAGVMAYQADQQFTRVRKVYNTTANQFSSDTSQQIAAQKELDQVRTAGLQTSLNTAKQYGVSMKDTLSIQADLAATGMKGNQLQAATTQVVRASMLGEIDYNTATKATIAMQQQLHLSSKQLADTWNYMNSVENATSLQMKDFATAIPIALGPIKLMGGDIKTLGTLLTGMVSRGVAVGKAANAIKAAAQRLINPSKTVADNFAMLTGADINKIGEKDKGNLLGMLQDIYEVTKNLSQFDRTKVFASLFGSYQLTTMSDMVESMGDLKKGVGQVTTAYNVGQQSAQKWGDVSDNEVKQFQNSLSGQFQRTIATVKAELAIMGVPFLKSADSMLAMIGKLLDGFNTLPKPLQRIAMYGALMIAAFGPLRMLQGLIANMAGTFIMFAGKLGLMATGWKTLTIEQKMELDAAQLAEKHMLSEAEAAAILAKNLQAVTYALQQQAIATAQASRGSVVLPTQMQGVMTDEQRLAYYKSQAPRRPNGQFASNAEQEAYAAAQMESYNQSAAKAAEETKASAANTTKIGTGTKVAAVAGGAFAASMAASLLSSNKTVDDIANMGMMLSIGIPAVAALSKGMVNLGTKVRAVVAGTAALDAETEATEGGMMATLLSTEGLLGPLGIALAGVTAIGAAAFLWSKHEDAISAARDKQNLAIYQQNDALNEALKIDQKRLQVMTAPSIFDPQKAGRGAPTVASTETALKSSPAGQDIIGAYKNAETAQDKLTVATQLYYNVLNSSHGTVQKAQMALDALFRAAGDGADDADNKVKELYKTLGDDETLKKASVLYGGLFSKAMEADTDNAKSQAQDLAAQMMDEMRKGILAHKGDVTGAFAEIEKQVAEANTNAAKQAASITPGAVAAGRYGAVAGAEGLNAQDEKALALQKEIVDYYKQELGITQNITTLKQLEATYEFKLSTVTPKTAQGLLAQQSVTRDISGMMSGLLGNQRESTTEIKKQTVDEINKALAANGYNYQIDQGNDKLKDMTSIMANIPDSKTITVAINQQQMGQVWQTAMSGVQSQIVSDANNQFDAQQQAAENAQQQRQQSAQEAFQFRQQKAQDAFDKHWQHRENVINHYYNNAEKKITHEMKVEQDAENLRQKLYEAEQARLDQQTEGANNGIDFNVALQQGQLDEAAKLQNDMNSSAEQFALSQAQTQDQAQAQRRQNQLTKQKNHLEKERQQKLKELQNEEKDAQEHFQRMQQMQSDAFQQEQDAQKNALEAEWAARKANLQQQLDLFSSYVAQNKTDLQNWMKTVGLQYSQFGTNTLLPMSNTWGGYFQTSFLQNLREAGAKVASDNMWTTLGKDSMHQMLAGMGFPTLAGFKNFIATGNLPNNFGKPAKKHNNNDDTNTPHGHIHQHNQDPSSSGGPAHKGGVAGVWGTGRGGYTGPLHPDEQWTLTKKGERIISPEMSQRYANVLDAIHHGRYDERGGPEIMPGIPALVSGVGSHLFMSGAGMALNNIVDTLKKENRGTPETPGSTGANLLHVDTRGLEPIGRAAIDWASHEIGDKGWYYQCLKFVRTALGAPSSAKTAALAWDAARYKVGIGNTSNVPPGVPVFWHGGSKGDGHVALSTGDGHVISTDFPVIGTVGTGTIAGITQAWGEQLMGWTEDINGKRVYVPQMRVGGDITRDGLYYGHAGERVLTKPLTQELDKIVSAFGAIAGDRRLQHGLSQIGDGTRGLRGAFAAAQPVASGDCYHYDIPISVIEPNATADEIADAAVRKIAHAEARKPTRRTNRKHS